MSETEKIPLLLFNETHLYDESMLTFIKSTNIQAFPCGRRSSAVNYDKNSDGKLDNEKYYFPFDPEARLNTEANNRKHSSLNGYTQTYLKQWNTDSKLLTMSLAGYLFSIYLVDKQTSQNTDFSDVNAFGTKVINCLKAKAEHDINIATTYDKPERQAFAEAMLAQIDSATRIYANIIVEDVHLFSSNANEYFTSILRDQFDTANIDLRDAKNIPEQLLDLLNRPTAEGIQNLEERRNPENYYFSGLSFSTTPLTGESKTRSSSVNYEVPRIYMPDDKTTQLTVSLCILERPKVGVDEHGNDVFADTWQIHQPAYLPFIEHGSTEDSIVVTGDTLIKSNLTVGSDEENTGNITSKSMVVPYTDPVEREYPEVLSNTEINVKGLFAPYLYAKLLEADALNVGDDIHTDGNIDADGNITAKGNIATEDNINVGTPANPATADNGGCIAAKNDITAERDLIAKNDLQVDGNATVEGDTQINGDATIETSLVVGTRTDDDSAEAGVLTAKKHVETPTLNASTSITTPQATIGTTITTTANVGTLNGDDIQQKIGEAYCNVPVMFIKKDENSYQLQLSRVNKIGF